MKTNLSISSLLRSTLVLLALTLVYSCQSKSGKYKVDDKGSVKAQPFDLSDVKLLESPFKLAMELDAEWLLRLEPDRLLYRFHENAGLEPKADIYGGWESRGVSGHSLGHYLSACSRAYLATGDQEFLQRVNYIVNELAICQQARGTGYVGGIPDEDKIFNEVSAGDIHSAGFDLNGGWVPWYTLHKLWAGLLDAYLLTDNEQAKEVVVNLSDWAVDKFKNLTEEQFQKMLDCEHGGMNESLAEVYAITGDKKYLDLSRRFHHDKVLDPLKRGEDNLEGLHANTQIPKIIGCARRYALTGNEEDAAIARNFWQIVTQDHTYAIGGNSDHEHFGPSGKLNDRLSDNTTETCNTYNMLKLTRELFMLEPSASYFDYFERALYNHILASQNPEDGMVIYYVPLASGSEKSYSTAFDSFWCCTGSGMENHVKYGESIYFEAEDGGLFVNLFIPSELNWQAKKAKILMNTQFPESETVSIAIETAQAIDFPMHVRYPSWARGIEVKLNGEVIKIDAMPGSFFTISNTWKNGDILEVRFPMALHLESMPDNPNRNAVLYGPIVLGGELGTDDIDPVYDIPVILANTKPIEEWIEKEDDKLVFNTVGVGRPADISLIPFYKLHHQKQMVYFDMFNDAEWLDRQEAFEAEKLQARALELRTTDLLRIGEMQPERDHNLTGENTETGDMGNRKWRHATNGGWFAFDMNTGGNQSLELLFDYWGSDGGNRNFDILVDGQVIATEKLEAERPNQFIQRSYQIPKELLQNKNTIIIKVQAHPGSIAGGLFGARLVKLKST